MPFFPICIELGSLHSENWWVTMLLKEELDHTLHILKVEYEYESVKLYKSVFFSFFSILLKESKLQYSQSF